MSSNLDLSSYQNILQTSFVKLVVPAYGTLRMSNYDVPIQITESDGQAYTYSPMGTILAISEFNNELRPSNTDVTISLATIDQDFIPAMMAYNIKGSLVEIRRAFFDTTTHQMLAIADNPSLRFTGVIANYNFSDTLNDYTQSNTTTINVSCSSIVKVLQSKKTGQITNDATRKSLYPGDIMTINLGGTGFQFEVLTTDSHGGIATFGYAIAGSGFTDGVYTNVALVPVTGSGTQGQATITVSGGIVSNIVITNPGINHQGQDSSFSRVAIIATTNFDFGVPV